jgi:iron complex outermembrane receptor protein
LNTNVQINKSQTFFFWETDTARGTLKYYQPFGGLADSSTTINKNQGQRINVDPYLIYVTPKDTRHTLRTRWFRTNNDIPEKQQSSRGDTWFGEYQIQKSIKSKSRLFHDLNVVGGLVASYSNIVGELYGSHTISNMAPYVQLEKKINRLWLSTGGRFEFNRVDNYKTENKPVVRAGMNYELTKATFIRASFGQGYRYPTVAERFVRTSFGASNKVIRLALG